MSKIVIRYGVMAESIKDQLKRQGVEIETNKFDKIHNAIKILYIHEYISESQMKKCLDKLSKSIDEHISMLKKEEEENE